MGRAALFSMQGQAHSGRSLHRWGTGQIAGKLAHIARRGLKLPEYGFSWLSLCY